MRKITERVVTAFLAGDRCTVDNTLTDGRYLYLFGNAIAKRDGKRLFIRTMGFDTVTTRERLNTLPGVSVWRHKGVLYLNGKPWEGNQMVWTKV